MNKILLLVFLAMTFSIVQGQSLSTRLEKIEINGKEAKKSYKVFFLSNDKWIESEKTSTGFIIPSELKCEEYLTILITFGKYKLEFSKIPISKFNEDWIVGVDKKPFSEEYVKPEEMESIKRVYYIQFLGKSEVTQLVVKEKKIE